MSMLPIPQLEFASTNPATMNTSGPVRLCRVNQSDRIAHPKMTTDNAARAASFICGTPELMVDVLRIVSAPTTTRITRTW